MTPDLTTYDLLALASHYTTLRREAGTRGGEWAGPCPICHAGRNRFRVQPHGGADGRGIWTCRSCRDFRWSDAIELVRAMESVSFREAITMLHLTTLPDRPAFEPAPPPPIEPPCAAWQERATAFYDACCVTLWHDAGAKARAWLQARGLSAATITAADLGYNPADTREDAARWGLDGHAPIWLPRGIVIPWTIGADLWRVNIRRPLTAAQLAAGEPKYIGPAGWRNALYRADQIAHRTVVLVEGEFDALLIDQEAGDLCDAVATGSTSGAQHWKWIGKLALAPRILVAFDGGDGEERKGDAAARYWLEVFGPRARRWRPYVGKDPTELFLNGFSLHAWVEAGLEDAL